MGRQGGGSKGGSGNASRSGAGVGTKGQATPTTPGKPVSLEGLSIPALEIKTRHHFSSKLQRMSTIARTKVRIVGLLGLNWVKGVNVVAVPGLFN